MADGYFEESILPLPNFPENELRKYKKSFAFDMFQGYLKKKASKYLGYRIIEGLPFGIKPKLIGVSKKSLLGKVKLNEY